MTAKTLGVFITAAAVLFTVTWWNNRHAQARADELRSITEANDRISEQLARAEARFELAEKRRDTLRSAPAKNPPVATAATTIRISNPTPAAKDPLDDPVLQNLQLQARRAQFEITYGSFYRSANLSASQIEALEDALLKREEQQADLWAATAKTGGTPGVDPAFQRLSSDILQDYRATQQALLGETRARELDQFERLTTMREIVSGLAAAAAMAGSPLNSQQAEQLVHALGDASATYLAGRTAMPSSIDWIMVHEQAKTFLTTSQLTFIETTEARGPRGMGGRFLPQLHAVARAAAEADAAAKAK